MVELIIGAIILFIIIYFVNQSNEKQRKIEDEKKRVEKVRQQAEIQKRQEEERKLNEAKRLEKERLQKIEDKKNQVEKARQQAEIQKRQEEERLHRQIQEQKNEEQRKLNEKKRLEKERLQKIEDEKYETLIVVDISKIKNEKYPCVVKRANNTFSYLVSGNILTLNSNLKILKEKTETFTWLTESQHIQKQNDLKKEIEQEFQRLQVATKQKVKDSRISLQETGTEYSIAIKPVLQPIPDFWKAYEFNVQSTSNLRYTTIFDSLSNGTVIIQEPQTLINYMASYGGHHYQKLQTSYSALFSILQPNSKIEILDYGCGQALASTILYDYAIKNNKTINVERIILIEPSNLALERGILTLNYFIDFLNQTTEIIKINKSLDDVTNAELSTLDTTIKIHLFSNIIDVVGFDFVTFANRIKQTQKGQNIFICVSPFNGTAQNRILGFQNCFINQNVPCTSEIIYKKAFDVISRQWNDNYRITMFQRIFQSNL